MLKFPGDTMKECTICGKRVQVKSMRRHEVTHMGGPSFQCSECDTRPFRHKYQLDVHVANKHQGKTYLCNICNREFDSPNAVGVHRRDKHDLPGYVRCTIAECKSKKFLRKHAGSHLDRVHQLRDVADVSQYVVDVPFGAPEETMAQQMKQSTLESSSSAYASGDLSPDISRSDSPPYLGAPSEGPGRRYSPSPSSSFIASPTRSSISPLNDIRGPSVLSSPILLKPQTANVSLQRTSSDPKLSYINSTRLPAHLHDSRMTNERENNSASNRLPSFNTLFPDISRVQLTDDRTEFSDIPSPFVQTVSSPIRLCPPREPYTDAQQRLERPPASPSMASERFERPHSSRRDTEIDTRYHQQWTEGSSRDIMIRAQTPPTSRSRRMSISDILNPAEHRQSFVHALSRPRPGHSYNVPSTHPKNDGGRHSY